MNDQTNVVWMTNGTGNIWQVKPEVTDDDTD